METGTAGSHGRMDLVTADAPSNSAGDPPPGTMPPPSCTSASSPCPNQDGLPTLSTDLSCRILSFLSPNDLAWSGRLTCKDAAERFRQPHHRAIQFNTQLPLAGCEPASVSPDSDPQSAQHKQQLQLLIASAESGLMPKLTIRRKMYLTAAAAATGCMVNLEVAWALQRSCLFVNVGVPTWVDDVMIAVEPYPAADGNPGEHAARAGHARLLPWLVQQGCPLNPGRTLAAVAQYCDLGTLQAAWRLLRGRSSGGGGGGGGGGGRGGSAGRGAEGDGDGEWGGGVLVQLDSGVLNGAARSRTVDAIAKVEWVLRKGEAQGAGSGGGGAGTGVGVGMGVGQRAAGGNSGGACALTEATAVAAAEASNLPLLQWLYGMGCPMQDALAAALRHADLHVAAWLVSYGGCTLPKMDGGVGADAAAARLLRTRLTVAAATAADGITKLDWLRACGVPPSPSLALEAAAEQGRLDTVRHLHQVHGVQLSVPVFRMAVASGSMPLLEWLVREGCVMYHGAFLAAGEKGNLAMVRWLLDTAHCPFRGDTAASIVRLWSVSAPAADCLAAVQQLVAAGCPVGGPLPFPHVAKTGDVPLVRWLYDAGGWAMDQHTLYHAAHVGCDALLEWLVAAGCPTAVATAVDPYPPAAFARARSTMQSLIRLGVPMRDGTLVAAVRRGCPVVVLQWLVEQGAPAGLAVATAALAAAAHLSHSTAQGEVEAWLEALVAAGAAATAAAPGVAMAAAVGAGAAMEDVAPGGGAA